LTLPVTATESSGIAVPLRRAFALTLRHLYLYTGSWPRLVEMMYWPILNIAMFGFISLSIVNRFGHADVMTETFLAGLLLGEMLTRVQTAMLVFHMEEVWSRNLGHLFASPLRLRDYVGGLVSLSLFRSIISVAPAYLIAYYLFDFSILKLGWMLPIYIGLLCFNGWLLGMLIVSLLLRFGLAAEWLGWMSTWLFMPFMAPYYPVSVLPKAFQYVSWSLPGTYVFESMKEQLASGAARFDYLGVALALNVVYFLGSVLIFFYSFRSTKKSGGLLQMGE
jgi:ABC-2 type transport system permease protein